MSPSIKTPRSDPTVFRDLSLIAGHPALDFINTVKYRGAIDPQDRLASMADVIEWANAAGLITATEVRVLSKPASKGKSGVRSCKTIRNFREDVRTIFEHSSLKGTSCAQAAARVELAISALHPVAKINRNTGVLERFIAVTTQDDLMDRIVASVADLLCERDRLRIKFCKGDNCDWIFIDRSKPGRRQWCDTRTCGNISRVRRFREKL